MGTVSELMSASISNAIVAQRAWDGIIILANNYGAESGKDSTEAIQKAINDAKEKGKHEVWFQPGAYTYTTLTNTEGIVFVGDGVIVTGGTPAIPVVSTAQLADIAIDVMTQGASGTGTTDDSEAFEKALLTGDTILVPHGRTFLIGDVEVDGKRVIGGGKVKKKSGSTYAFIVKGTGAVIEGLTFEAESTSGQPNADIKLADGCKDVRILRNTFKSPTYAAVVAAGEGDPNYTNPVDGIIFADNIVSGYARPLYMYSMKNITISRNIFRDTLFDAIRTRVNDTNILITNNQFINIGNGNWSDEQTRDAVDTLGSGLNLNISHNLVDTTAYHGFDIKGLNNNVKIEHNQVFRTRYSGIVVTNGDTDKVVNIDINFNTVSECNQAKASIGDAAILLNTGILYPKIIGNTVVSNFARGIYLWSGCVEPKIAFNTCINNGIQSGGVSAGIWVVQANGAIIEGNTCENVADLPNPFQGHGIYCYSSAATNPKKMAAMNNRCRNNLVGQFTCEPNGDRATGFYWFSNNYMEGTGEYSRTTWQRRRGIFFGNGDTPPSGDGAFSAGDIIFDYSPTAGGNAGLIALADGTPATWAKFGIVDLQGSITWDPGDLADGAGETSSDITVTGAAVGDYVIVSAPYNTQGIIAFGWVSAANTCKIRIQNFTGSNVNLASGTWRVKIVKP